MTLLHASRLALSFGSRTVFEDLSLTLEEGERVGLVGVNGSGKSSLMRMLARVIEPDRGEVQLRRLATVTYLAQEPEFSLEATVASELAVARAPLKAAIEAHSALSARLAAPHKEEDHERLLSELAVLSDRVEHLGGWDTSHEARRLLDRLGVRDWERPISELSGGTRKRVAIARALLSRPELLLLDEPTNHLDADTVDWLEEELDGLAGALLLVTHDRYFLDDLVDRIIEIVPGAGVTSWPGNYEAYLEQKLVAQELASLSEHKRQRWIEGEVAWLRRGVEARRTKSKARIERARKLLADKGFERPKVAALRLAEAPRLSHVVLEAKGLEHSFGERRVLGGVDFTLSKGERVGIVGPNGAGKTTFLRILLGELAPDKGEVLLGKKTRIAYHDQERVLLDPDLTVYEAAGGSPPGKTGEDFVEILGRKIILRDYLDDLLFPETMQRMAVKALSGGERNRLLLAKLFLEGANVLVLDEPTNDLDLVTLNVLEQLLLDFAGSVLIVTHDRYFLDKVATAILAFEGDGKATRWPGNYEMYRSLKDQLERQRRAEEGTDSVRRATTSTAQRPALSAAQEKAKKPAKLGFKEQRELEGMEEAILLAEEKKSALETSLSDPETYRKDGASVAQMRFDLEAATAKVERLYARWQELEALRKGS